ncbi:hypothetical protein ACWCQW_37745 [Streptomyces mirabilis]
MSYDVTPPTMPAYPPPPPPKKSRTNLVIIGSAAAVIVAVVATGVTVNSSGNSEAKPGPTVTVTETTTADDTAVAADDNTEPAAEDTSDGVYALDDTVTYQNDVEITLSGFRRTVSGQYAEPENTPYAKFTVKIKNGGSKKLDTTLLSVNCSYGTDGKSSEAIFDSDGGLDGGPSTQLLPGRSLNVPWGCELPKAQKLIQIEVAPDFDSETAIFTGNVK